jgi:hypothetical protein
MAHTQKLPRGKEFEQLVADLLKLKGYEVSHNEIISGTQIDVVAKWQSLK